MRDEEEVNPSRFVISPEGLRFPRFLFGVHILLRPGNKAFFAFVAASKPTGGRPTSIELLCT
jgi:hypothetical protein